MITEDYVSFETAKLLNEKGFDCACRAFWKEWNNRTTLCDCSPSHLFEYCHNSMLEQYNNDEELNIACPTLQMTMKWLRKKGFHIFVPMEIDYDEDERGGKWYHDAAYYPEIRRVSDGKIMYDDGSLYASPEQAYEAAIKYCLENLI